ncbi:hypothetical protein [Gordonia soli]|uniref:Uncharacterized protein n=1 Tax=Gordonia soli NBRC 108243 TaxID=1223545 RepID=M0QHB2_9ACTN|nr:hypothetical protein [Gordonia soli]GAC67923.1 hypothetical protein GS4_11_01920 [Gordonia soli NBRC 108243]
MSDHEQDTDRTDSDAFGENVSDDDAAVDVSGSAERPGPSETDTTEIAVEDADSDSAVSAADTTATAAREPYVDDAATDRFDVSATQAGVGVTRRGPRAAIPAVRTSAALVILIALFISAWYAAGPSQQYLVSTSPAAQVQGAPSIAVPGLAPGAAAAAPSPGAPAAGGPAPAASIPLGGAPGASVPLGGAAGAAPGGSTSIGNGAAPGVGATPGGSTAIDGGNSLGGLSTAPIADQPRCPLGWPKPERSGGLASVIVLAPAAGSFSSEAFALGSVYQPLMQLIGPVLAEIEPVLNANVRWINPIVERASAASAVVLEAILPFYGPYRAQFLAAEGNLAKALAPVLTRIYQSPQAACLVAWQGQIIASAKGKRITTASLSRPGRLNHFG